MSRPTRRPLAPGEVPRLAAEAGDSRAFRAAVLQRLRPAVPFDWYAWVLTDPATTVGTDPLAEVPDLGELPRLVRLRYRSPTRWTHLHPVGVLGAAADRSPLWREVQRHHGVVDVLSLVLRDRFGCWGFLDLWSTRPFTARDVSVLEGLAPMLTTGLREHQARTFGVDTDTDVPGGPVVLLLDDDLRVTGQTPAADPWLRALLTRADGKPPVPAVAYNVAAQLLAVEAGVDDHPPTARVRLAGATWVTVRGSRVEPSGAIAVTIEPATPEERLDLFTRAHALTTREADLLGHLARGADTREVATLMFLSPYTVQDHLTSIFAKTGVRTRRVLLSRALGVPVSTPPTGAADRLLPRE